MLRSTTISNSRPWHDQKLLLWVPPSIAMSRRFSNPFESRELAELQHPCQLSRLLIVDSDLLLSLDSAFHAQEGDRSFIKDYYLSSTFVFNEDAPPADTTGRFTLLTIDRRERATAPPEYKEFLDNAASPNAVHLLSIVLSRGVGEGFANTFTLQPYRDLGYEAYPYCESWREAFMSELADPNPYGDALIPFMGRINRESPSQVERRRAERVLANR